MNEPRLFALRRDEDVTGISGTGDVAYGVEFPNGVVALCWQSEWPTSVVFHDRGMASVEAIHGHGGATRIVWLPEKADEVSIGREKELRRSAEAIAAHYKSEVDRLLAELEQTRARVAALAEAYNVTCAQHRELEAAVMEEWGHNQNQSMQARRVLGPDAFDELVGSVTDDER